MPKTQFQKLLEARIEKAVHDTALSVVTSPCADYGSYRDRCGYVSGLLEAINLAEDIQKESE